MTETAIDAPKQERGERRRRRMIEVATEIFLERGYGGASLDEIVKRSGGSRRDIYAWFGTKEELFGAVITSACSEIFGAFAQADFDSDEPIEALTDVCVTFIATLLTPRVLNLYRLVIGESGRHPQLGQIFYERGPATAIRQLADVLTLWNKKSRLQISDPHRAAEFILEMMKGDLHLKVLFSVSKPPSTEDLRNHVRDALKLLKLAQ